MRAIGYNEKGGVEVLTEIELPRPEPGPRDLLVAVKAVAVNPGDVKRRRWEKPATAPDYMLLGYGAARFLEAVGNGLSPLQPGGQGFYAGATNPPGNKQAR